MLYNKNVCEVFINYFRNRKVIEDTNTQNMKMVDCSDKKILAREEQPKQIAGGVGYSGTVAIVFVTVMTIM